MNKTLLLFLFFVLHAFEICAQELAVKFFKVSDGDILARTAATCRYDTNDKYCALIKVGIALDGVVFECSGGVRDVVKKTGEYWVYLPQNNSKLRILHKDYTPLEVNFYDYGIGKVQSGVTYVLTIVKPHNNNEPFDAGGNFYVLKVEPKNATVSIDDVMQFASSDGEYSAMLPYGEHSYKVEAGGYNSKKGTFTVSNGEMSPIVVKLSSAMIPVTIICKMPGVSMYVDKKLVAKDSIFWDGELPKGMHFFEIKKEGYHSFQTTMQVGENGSPSSLIAVEKLTAIQGSLSVNYKPFGADVYVDGEKLGQSPRVFNGLLIGKHHVEVRKEGYTTDRKTVIISEGQTANIMGTLSSQASGLASNSISASVTSGSNEISIPVKNGITIDMVKVEAGTFMMGATSEMQNPWKGEKPVHQVTLTKDYYIGKYEVTQDLWRIVMGRDPSCFKGYNLPVEQVSWNDCQEFISRLNGMTGRNFRLPTEAEWEYAARGGKKSHSYQYSGSNNISDVAWYDGNSGNKTHPVGTKQANELGLYDMTGNVWEWCQDWYGPYSSSSLTNPTGAASGRGRVFRGGCWYGNARNSRSAYRFYVMSDCRLSYLGLRLALSE